MSRLIPADDVARLLLRLAVGGLLLFHGIHKLTHGIDGVIALVESKGMPTFVAYGVYAGELLAPAMLIAGYLTRLAAAAVIATMLFILVVAHPGDLFHIGKHGALAVELPAFYLLGAAAIALLGCGRYGLSRGRGRFD